MFGFKDFPASGTLIDEQGRVVCEKCGVAKKIRVRLRGLLGRTPPEEGCGLLFPRTRSVHTYFMSFPIDIVFLDRELHVLAVDPAVRPFKVSGYRGAKSILELRSGEAARVGLVAGSRLSWR